MFAQLGSVGRVGFPNMRAASISAVLKAKAVKIVTAANGYTTRGLMGSAPIVVVGGGFGSSTVPGGTGNTADNPNVVMNDARIVTSGPIRQLDGNLFDGFVGAWTSLSALFDGGDGWSARFKTNSRYVELSYSFGNTGSPDKIRLRVDGLWAQAADYVLFTTADFAPHYALIDLASIATRNVEIFFGNIGTPVGFNFSPGATLTVPDTSVADVAATFFGDSYVAGNTPGLDNIRNTTVQAFGEIMGVKDIVAFGRGGQGYVTQVDSHTIGQRMSLDAGRVSTPDVVYAMGSVNDRTASTATITTNISSGIQALQAAYPNTWIVFFVGFTALNAPVDAAHFNAAIAGVAAIRDARTLIIDTTGYPTVTNTGSLPNSALHDSADGIHPGPNEVAYLTGRMKTDVVAAIRAKAHI